MCCKLKGKKTLLKPLPQRYHPESARRIEPVWCLELNIVIVRPWRHALHLELIKNERRQTLVFLAPRGASRQVEVAAEEQLIRNQSQPTSVHK